MQSVTEADFQINKLTIGSHTSTGSRYPSALAMHFSKGGKRSRTRALVRIFQAANKLSFTPKDETSMVLD